jgi:hypothetical protein
MKEKEFRISTIQEHLGELGELRVRMEEDADKIRQLLNTRKSQFSIKLYTTYLEEQTKQIQNICKFENQLLNEKKSLESKSA